MNAYLLQRVGRKNKSSLYIMYVKGKKRYYDFLKLYLYTKPISAEQRDHNKSIKKLSQQILSQKILDAQYIKHGQASPVRGKVGLLQFFDKVVSEKKLTQNTIGVYNSCRLHLQNYLDGGDIEIQHVDELFLQNFQQYMLNLKDQKGNQILKTNSMLAYYSKLCSVLKDAYRQRFIIENCAAKVKSIKSEQPKHKNHLDTSEIIALMNTNSEVPLLSLAFIFSCYSGLRFVDVKAMTWEMITYNQSNGYQLNFRQQKTGGVETLPLITEAVELLHNNFAHRNGVIFQDLKYSAYNNEKLNRWFSAAGLTKKLTYHCSRVAFATRLLTENIDAVTISRLLGHRSLNQVNSYIKLVDLKKINAVKQLTLAN